MRPGAARLPTGSKSALFLHPFFERRPDHITSSKAYSEYFDPCQEAAQKSIRCLHRNGGDREMCTDFFQYESSIRFFPMGPSSSRASSYIHMLIPLHR